jgi:hypothetical protein
MKLHAAALALVVWYLMVPPLSFSGSGFGMRSSGRAGNGRREGVDTA